MPVVDQAQESQNNEIMDLLDGMTASTEVESKSESDTTDQSDEKESHDKKEEEVKTDVEKGEERESEETTKQGKDDELESKEKKVTAEHTSETQPEHKEDVQETELERYKRENEELRKHLEEIADKVFTPKPQPKMTPEEEQEAAKKAANQVLPFLKSDEVFDEALKSAHNFNALLTSVVNTAVERSLRIMPQIASQIADSQITLKTSVENFYRDNQDLIPHKKYVGYVANEIAAQHPEWTLLQVLQETEKEARTRLRLARNATQQTTTSSSTTVQQRPGFVPSGGGGGRRRTPSSDNMSEQEKSILDLLT